MARKGKSTEEIIQALREAEVRLGQGETVGKICRGFGISEQTYYIYGRLSRCKRFEQFPATLGANIYPASPGMLARPNGYSARREPQQVGGFDEPL